MWPKINIPSKHLAILMFICPKLTFNAIFDSSAKAAKSWPSKLLKLSDVSYFNTAEISLAPGLKYNKITPHGTKKDSFDSWTEKHHNDTKFVHIGCQVLHLYGIMAKVLSSCCTLAHPRDADFIVWWAASLWPQCTMVEASAIFLKSRFIAHTLIRTRPQRSLKFRNVCIKWKWYICRISGHDTTVSYGLSDTLAYLGSMPPLFCTDLDLYDIQDGAAITRSILSKIFRKGTP